MKKWLSFLLAAATIMTLFSGCGTSGNESSSQAQQSSQEASSSQQEQQQGSEPAGSQTETEKGTRIFTDSCGREVEVPLDIQKVAPAGNPAQMMLYSLVPDRMVGWSEKLSNMTGRYMEDKYASLPVFGKFYGKNASLNMEALAAAQPDVIIDVGEVKKNLEEDLDGLQKQIGIPVVFIEETMDTMGQAYTMLGDLLDCAEDAKPLADYCDNTVGEAKEKAASIPEDKRLTVYYGEGESGLNANPAGSLHADVIDLVGGVNVAETDVVSSSGGSQVTMEQLLLWNPDILLFGPDVDYDAISTDPIWKDLDAVQRGSYYQTPNGPYNWMGRPPAVNRVLGIKWFGNLLYPEVFDYDIPAEAKEFYKLFYHYDLTDEEIRELMVNSTGM